MKKNIQKISMTALFALVFVVAPMHAQAAFNTLPNDCPTVSVANHTTQQNANLTCWGPSISANPGDTVDVRIYYHNTDTNPANAIVHLNNPVGSILSTFNFTGFINSSTVGSATINVSSPQTMTLGTVSWYPDKSVSPSSLPGGDQSLFNAGANLGTIQGINTCPSGQSFCHSGSVVVSFIVGGSTNNGGVTGTCSVNSFTINGSSTFVSVPYGSTATLAWNTTNCGTVTVDGIAYSGAQANSNSITTAPIIASKTFSFAAGSVQRAVTVTPIGGGSSCSVGSFSINGSQTSAVVPFGTPATLSWTTSNCSSVVVNGVTYTGVLANSNSIQTPAITYSQDFKLIAGSISRVVTATPSAQAASCVASSFTANGVSSSVTVTQNTPVTLAWITTGCTSATVNGITYSNGQQNSGNFSIGTPSIGTYPYTLFAVDSTGHTSQLNVTVNVTGTIINNTCQITYFQPTSSTVGSGNSTTLNWTLSSGCTGSVTLSGTNYPSAQVYGNSITIGPIYAYSTYTLTAYGSNGISTTATTYINVNSISNNSTCYISSFTANGLNSAQVVNGSTATIMWNTYGCSNVTVSGPGIYSQNASGSMPTSAVYGSATYTITASSYNSFYGGSPVTQTVYVTTTQPYIVAPTNMNPITTIATNVSTTSARLNGLIPANASQNYGTVNAYFEYGTSSGFGRQTNPQVVSTYTLLNYFDTIFTSPNTTYYYRAVMNSNGVITTGNTVSFTTPGYNTNTNTTTNTTFINTTTRGTGTGSAFASIVISDQYQNVAAGDLLNYTVTYKNISSSTLSNAMINVVLPNGVTYKGSSQGMPTTNNTIVITLGSLSAGATGFVNIQATVDSNVVAGNNLLATATLTFATPSGAQDTAIAYYLNTVAAANSNNLAGFAFGAGFFPTTFLGWVLLLGILIIIILVARHYAILSRNAQNGKVTTDVHDMHSTSTH